MKDFFISDAPRFENQVVTSYFCIASLQLRERKQSGGQYLALTLADKSGQFEARMWEEFSEALLHCKEGCHVKAQGQISKYQGKFQITLTKMRAAPDSEIELADFVRTSEFDIEEMAAELRGYVEAFTHPDLRRLILSFLDDPEIGPRFKTAPAAKRLHHAWIGGLLEHVLTLVRVCRAVMPFYPLVDGDLLVAGAILHDIGKVRELSWSGNFTYTLEGQLLGHISIAMGMLQAKIAELDRFAAEEASTSGEPPHLFPQPLRLLLEHMILAHHGKLEFGSPKLPMTAEAMLLSALDDLEAKFQTMRNEFDAAAAEGRASDAPTEWVRSMDRALFNSKEWMESQHAK